MASEDQEAGLMQWGRKSTIILQSEVILCNQYSGNCGQTEKNSVS